MSLLSLPLENPISYSYFLFNEKGKTEFSALQETGMSIMVFFGAVLVAVPHFSLNLVIKVYFWSLF